MKYKEFLKLQEKLTNEAKEYLNKHQFTKWEETIERLTNLQEKFISEETERIIKGGSSKSEKKAAAARENGKKGGRPKKDIK